MSIFDKSTYTTSLPYYIGYIYSYDITAAGYSILCQEQALDSEIIAYIATLPKSERVVYIGHLCQQDKHLVKLIEEGLKDAVATFCHDNNIQEDDIIAIRKDAVYSLVPAVKTDYNYIQWKEQGRYNSFYKFNNVECYYDLRSNTLDIKKMSRDMKLKHEPYFTLELKKLLKLATGSAAKYNKLLYLQQWSKLYLEHKLPYECYREFNLRSLYACKHTIGNYSFHSEFYMGDIIDISYNYDYVFKPILNSII